MYTLLKHVDKEILVGLKYVRMWAPKMILAVGIKLENK